MESDKQWRETAKSKLQISEPRNAPLNGNAVAFWWWFWQVPCLGSGRIQGGRGRDGNFIMAASKYGIEWSQGFGVGAVISLVVWLPAYFEVSDRFAEAWWYDFAIAFIVMAAVGTLAWVTGGVAEYLERRRGKRP